MLSYNDKQKFIKWRKAKRFEKFYVQDGRTLKEIARMFPDEIKYRSLTEYCYQFKWTEKRDEYASRKKILLAQTQDPRIKAAAMTQHWQMIITDALSAIQFLDPSDENYSADLQRLMKVVKEARMMERLEDNQPNSISASAMKYVKDTSDTPRAPRALIELTETQEDGIEAHIQADTSVQMPEEDSSSSWGQAGGEDYNGQGDNEEENRREEAEVVSDGVPQRGSPHIPDYSPDR